MRRRFLCCNHIHLGEKKTNQTLYLVWLELANQNTPGLFTIFRTLKFLISHISKTCHFHRFAATSSFILTLFGLKSTQEAEVFPYWHSRVNRPSQIMGVFIYLHSLWRHILESNPMHCLWVLCFLALSKRCEPKHANQTKLRNYS